MRKIPNERMLKALETLQTACAQRDCKSCILQGNFECLFSVERSTGDGFFINVIPENWDLREIRKVVYRK